MWWGIGLSAAILVGILAVQLTQKDERPALEPIRRAAGSAGLELAALRAPGRLESMTGYARQSWWIADGTRVGGPHAVDVQRDQRVSEGVRVVTLRDRRGGIHSVWVWVRWVNDEVEEVAFDTPLDRLV
jgi:hypothetical protein